MPAFLGIVRRDCRDHAADIALAEILGVLLGAHGMAIGDPVDHRRAEPRHRAEERAEGRAAQDQPPILQRVMPALPLAVQIDARVIFVDDGAARRRHIDQLGDGEDAERERHQRQLVPEIKRIEGPAQRAGLRVAADHRQHQAESGAGQAFERRLARQHGHHRQAEDAERQQFRRSKIKHHRPQHRDREREKQGAENAAHQRGAIAGAESARCLTHAGHRMAVEHRRRGADRAGHAEKHGRDEVRDRRHRRHAEQQGEGRERIEVIGEGDQDREPDHAAQPRNDAKAQAQNDARSHDREALGLENERQRLPSGFPHARIDPPY